MQCEAGGIGEPVTAQAERGSSPLRIDEVRCDGCGWCATICPADVLRIQHGKSTAAYAEDCLLCHLCVEECHTDAIRIDPTVSLRMPPSLYELNPAELGPGSPFEV